MVESASWHDRHKHARRLVHARHVVNFIAYWKLSPLDAVPGLSACLVFSSKVCRIGQRT